MDDSRTTGTQEAGTSEASSPGDLQYQELWFSLGRRAWSSVVLVPADRGGSADEVANRLAEVGKRISKSPVTAITATSLEYGTALALADLPSFVGQRGQSPQAPWPAAIEMPPSSLDQPSPSEETSIEVAAQRYLMEERSRPRGEDGPVVSSGARLIIAIPPVVTQPLGLATAQAADLVVLCVDLGATRLADARRTVELLGRGRMAGCFLIH